MARVPAIALFSGTLFLSAALLFLVQPMFARFVLPLLGGVPSVWTASVLFFQATLLAGYLYVHVVTRRLSVRRQLALHSALVLVPLAFLPLSVPDDWGGAGGGDPVVALAGLFLVSVAAPFFVLATTAPLLQRWLSSTTHRDAPDPYYLYAASNGGSVLGLLAYPGLLEPELGLDGQGVAWAVAYGVLAVLVLGCAAWTWRVTRGRAAELGQDEEAAAPLTWRRRVTWVALAFVPVTLMLAVTSFLTTDIAPIPLLWVIPLALYLASFIAVFSRRWEGSRLARLTPAATAIGLTLLAVAVGLERREPLWLIAFMHLSVLLLVALLCHGRVAADRPPAGRLTEFYLCLALGGALGGMFSAVFAPAVFDALTEYPAALVLAALCIPWRAAPRSLPADLVMPLLAAGAMALVLYGWSIDTSEKGPDRWAVHVAVAIACLMFALQGRPIRFALGIGLAMLAAWITSDARHGIIYRDRSFFGVRWVETESGTTHSLRNGTTLHGTQIRTPPNLRREPTTYYHRTGPFGQLLRGLPDRSITRRTGVVGLGTGSMACHARDGERWTFFEIDPAVERMARDPRLFSYLRDCAGRHDVVLGDARVEMRDVPSGSFGVIAVDAFNSDAIPTHLLTREALSLYRDRLTSNGVIALHISNRYLDIEPVVGNLARDLRMACLEQIDASITSDTPGKSISDWVALARRDADLGSIVRDSRWRRCRVDPSSRSWTDDYTNLLGLLTAR